MMNSAQRIVCLTEETVETLYLLGEQDKIVGITGYATRPAQARKEKPRVAAFTSAKIPKILELKPDLVLGFSDLQAEIAAELIKAGIEVHVFNQRSVSGILQMIRTLGRLVDAIDKADALAGIYQRKIDTLRSDTSCSESRPLVYFEEWFDPIISGIGWVSELINIAGGEDCFAELANHQDAKNRIIANPETVINRAPDIIIGSWCGRRFHPEKVAARPGWRDIPAVKRNHVYEIKSVNILQPGPAALTDGLDELHTIITAWKNQSGISKQESIQQTV